MPNFYFLVSLDGWKDDPYSNETTVYENQKLLENKLNVSLYNNFYENISEDTLNNAGKMFLYMNSCPRNVFRSELRKSFEDYLLNQNLKNILMFLNRILIKSSDNNIAVKKTATALIDRICHIKGLKFKKIHSILSFQKKTDIEKTAYFEKGMKTPKIFFRTFFRKNQDIYSLFIYKLFLHI